MPALTEQDKEFRRSHLCASEWAAALGESPWTPRMTLWGRKRGLLPPEPDKHVFRRGRDYEAIVLKWYREDHPPVAIIGPGPTREHLTEPWIAGTADALVDGGPLHLAWGLEAKTARSSRGWGEFGTDQVPRPYEIQCRLYMAIYGLDRWDIAVDLRDAEEPGYYTILRDLDKERELIEAGRPFWFENIVAGEAPEPTGADGEGRAIAAEYPRDAGEMIASTGEIEELATQLRLAKGRAAIAGLDAARFENSLKLSLGDAEGVEGSWGRITWRRSKDRVVTEYPAAMQDFCGQDAVSVETIALLTECLQRARTSKPGSRRFLYKPKEG